MSRSSDRSPTFMKVRRDHAGETAEDYVEAVLSFLLAPGVPGEDARRDAEGIEHYAGAKTLAGMERFVARHRGRGRRGRS